MPVRVFYASGFKCRRPLSEFTYPTLHHHPMRLRNRPRLRRHKRHPQTPRMSCRQQLMGIEPYLAQLQHHPHHSIVLRRRTRILQHLDMPQKHL